MSKIKLLLDVVEDMRSLADSLQSLADAMTQGEAPEAEPVQKAAPPPPKEPAVTLEQVRAVLADKSHDGKTEAVRELLQKYGAPKLSAVDPKHYPALLKDAEVLCCRPPNTPFSPPAAPIAGSIAIPRRGWNWSSPTGKQKPRPKAPPPMLSPSTSSKRR